MCTVLLTMVCPTVPTERREEREEGGKEGGKMNMLMNVGRCRNMWEYVYDEQRESAIYIPIRLWKFGARFGGS